MILKVGNRQELMSWIQDRKGLGMVFITTNGCFDLLHVGHVSLIQYCGKIRQDRMNRPAFKEQTPAIMVLVNTDESVAKLKPGRPLIPFDQRVEMVDALKGVDFVIPMPEADPRRLLQVILPVVHVKGAEYEGKTMPETELVEGNGGRILFAPRLREISTTLILNRMA